MRQPPRTALVTGASSGIGRSTAAALARRGHRAIGTSRDPDAIAPAASKAAIRTFADACRFELSPFGVWVTTVEPGAINTGISARRTRDLADRSPYAAAYDQVALAIDADEATGIAAGKVARTIVRAIEAPRPRPLYAVGSNAPLAFAFKRVAPRTLVERTVARRHGIMRR